MKVHAGIFSNLGQVQSRDRHKNQVHRGQNFISFIEDEDKVERGGLGVQPRRPPDAASQNGTGEPAPLRQPWTAAAPRQARRLTSLLCSREGLAAQGQVRSQMCPSPARSSK